jgi:hypothetical protein
MESRALPMLNKHYTPPPCIGCRRINGILLHRLGFILRAHSCSLVHSEGRRLWVLPCGETSSQNLVRNWGTGSNTSWELNPTDHHTSELGRFFLATSWEIWRHLVVAPRFQTQGKHESIFFPLWYCGLNSGPTLEPLHQPFFVIGFFEIGSQELFVWAGFKTRSFWSLPSE